MINSFKCKETKNIFAGKYSKKLPESIQERALKKLDMLDSATSVEDLRIPPGNRLERLKGDRKEQYSISVNMQFRICFKWINNNAEDVEIVDYH
jgi:toxin HigB-1